MLTCPKCIHTLVRTTNETGDFWRCTTCEGRAVSVPLLHKTIVKNYIDLLWLRVRKGEGVPGPACPACNGLMREVSRSSDTRAPNLDICHRCKLVWFDPKEYEEIMALSSQSPEGHVLSPKEKEFIDLHEAQLRRDMWFSEWSIEGPEEEWKLLPALFGLPVEYKETFFHRFPWITRSLVLIFAVVFIYFLRPLENFIQQFGLTPSQPWRYGGLTFLTSLFIHGSILNLLCNMYFLYTFGDNVEDYLGKRRYTLLILLTSFSGNLLHIAAAPQSSTPLIGSNYLISGLIVFYVLRFPSAEMGILLLLRRFRWFRLPVFEALIAWTIILFIGNRLHLQGFTNVFVLGHLGSASVGGLFWLIWRKK